MILPDFAWLKERADRVDGIVLTHGHEDHTGALRYLLRDVSAPLYGAPLTIGFARHRLTEAKMDKNCTFVEVRDNERVRAGLGGAPGDVHGLDKRGVGDADQHRHAMIDLFANALDEFPAQAVAQTRPFAGGSENKKAMHAAAENMFDELFQAGDIESVSINQGRDHRRDNSSQR